MNGLKSYSPLDERALIHGRTLRREPLELYWTGSSLELETDSGELWVELECRGGFVPGIRVELDGATVARVLPDTGINRLCAFRGIPHERRRVTVYREGQPCQGGQEGMTAIRAIYADGELYKAEPRKYRLEFVGDSVTAGEGLSGPASLTSGGAAVYSSRGNYALETGRLLGADVNIVAMSGWGAAASWDNNPENVTPRIYHQICGALKGGAEQGAWDFASWRPDAIIIHLGNNDFFALDEPGHTDPATGRYTKLRRGADGLPDRETAGFFKGAVYGFLKRARSLNPDPHIVWAYGVFNDLWTPYILEAMDGYSRDTGDENVSFAALPRRRDEYTGSNGHPGVLDHAEMAKALTEHLRRKLNIG